MAKRRTHDSQDYYDDAQDSPIGLTSAFEVVHDPQSVQYDEGDQAIGLTEAFARVGDPPEPRAWDEAGKWKDFDWDADWEGAHADAQDEVPPAPADEPAASEAQQSQPVSEAAGTSDEYEISPHAPFNDQARAFDVQKDLAHASAASVPSKATIRGRHAAHAPEPSERMRKSHRTRKRLIAIIVLLVLALCALGFFIFRTVNTGQQQAAHQVQEQIEAPKESAGPVEGDDATQTAAQLADVPTLTKLFGKKSDAALKEIGHGAFISNNQKVKEKGSAIKTDLTVSLADEPADSKVGAPRVYLGLDKNDKIIQVGYSAAASALGFGSLSFADAVNVQHVVEQTLRDIGADVEDGSAELPSDRSKYVTYAKDKTTVLKERCSFNGDTEVDGTACEWSAVLSYDYTTQVITGNLNDTVRVIYVYLTKK